MRGTELADPASRGRPDARTRIAGAVIVAAGIGLCVAALFAEQLGIGGDAAEGTFGWKQQALALAGASLAVIGIVVATQTTWSNRWSGPLIRALGSTWFLGVVLAALTWVPLQLTAAPGLDPSWQTGLNIGAGERLQFGSEIIFTFGPLGFVNQPQVSYAGPAIIGAIYQVALALALSVSLLWATRRSFPLPLALLLSFVAASLISREEALIPIALLWSVVALGPDPPPLARPLIVYGGGALSAFGLLYKLNVGIAVMLITAITVLALGGERQRRDVASYIGTLSGALAALWLASGQGAGNAVAYLSGSIEIVAGWAAAMALRPEKDWLVETAVLEVLVVMGAAAYVARKLPGRRSIAVLAILLIFCIVQLKIGFVRADVPHFSRFFAAMLVPWLALLWVGRQRLAVVAAVTATAAVWFVFTESRVDDVVQPVQRADAAFSDTRTLLDGARRSATRESARSTLRSQYPPIDPEALALLEGQGVHADPLEVSLIWAYGFDWQPPPVFQRITAFTSALDHENADALAADDGPPRILRHRNAGSTTRSIDSRYGPFEAPAQTLAMLCNYRALHTDSDYQVLGKIPNRCSDERPLGRVEVAFEEWITVPRPPAPDRLVIARVEGLEPSRLTELLTPLVRSEQRAVVFDDELRFRVVPATAPDGLILAAPRAVDFPGDFALVPRAKTISFSKENQSADDEAAIQIEFSSVRATPFSDLALSGHPRLGERVESSDGTDRG